MLYQIVDGCIYLYQNTHTHTNITITLTFRLVHIFGAWLSGETKSTSKITLECNALPFSDDSFKSPARPCLSIYFIMSALFFCSSLSLSLVPVSLYFSRSLSRHPFWFAVSVFRCQYLTWFLFHPVYLFIIHFRNHFYFYSRLFNGSRIYSTKIWYICGRHTHTETFT